jgi:hypothetical protein
MDFGVIKSFKPPPLYYHSKIYCMKMQRNIVLPLLAIIFIMTAFFACQKEIAPGSISNNGKTKFSVFLTDGPLDFQKVLIDIRGIEVKLDTCRHEGDDDHDDPGCDDHHDSLASHCEIWDTLPDHPGVYDLLTLRNGTDTLLASGFVLHGKIIRIKFILGNNNSLMVDSITYPLHLVDSQHFVFVNIHREHVDSLSSTYFSLFLDFDLSHSIWYFNGAYWLKPVLRPFSHREFGSIEGKVRPVHSYGIIKAFNATDTAFARPEDEGEFRVIGLHPGTYSLLVKGINGYRDTTINNIPVQRDRETALGTVNLSH